jgi:hypothetical protein
MLTTTVSRDWPIQQLNVKNVFLHGTLYETVFCSQPTGFADPAHPDLICRLRKSLYGLKQAPRAWYSRFATYLTTLGSLKPSRTPRCSSSVAGQTRYICYFMLMISS